MPRDQSIKSVNLLRTFYLSRVHDWTNLENAKIAQHSTFLANCGHNVITEWLIDTEYHYWCTQQTSNSVL